jgi:hypothetical protein
MKQSLSSTVPTPKMQRQISLKPFDAGQSDRVLELRLFHHYTQATCVTTLKGMVPLLNNPMWHVDIPQIAFSSPIVLDALLGVSSAHLMILQPEDQRLALASRSYFNKALTKQRESLRQVTAENAESLLVAAVLIAHQTWLVSHYHSKFAEERYDIAMNTFQMCQGIIALLQNASQWLNKYSWMMPSDEVDTDTNINSKGFMKHCLEDLASLSVHFHKQGTPPENSAAYKSFAEKLVVNYSLLLAEPMDVIWAEQSIVTILHRVSSRFPELLTDEDPLAMALMARDLALLSFMEGSQSWWIHGGGKYSVAHLAISRIRKLMPTNWLWTLDFPSKILAKEVTLDMA